MEDIFSIKSEETFSGERESLSPRQVVEKPVTIMERSTSLSYEGVIEIEYDLTEADLECVKFSLRFGGKCFCADRPDTCFESSLLQICSKCGNDFLLKCCFTCQWSDYSPAGNDDYGGMACYRNHKEIYRTVNSKDDYFEKLDGLSDGARGETKICHEYQERLLGFGYRGMLGD